MKNKFSKIFSIKTGIILLYTGFLFFGLITKVYATTNYCNDASVAGCWYMNGITNGTEVDRSSNGNDLTLSGITDSQSLVVPTSPAYAGYSRLLAGGYLYKSVEGGVLDINGATAKVSITAWIKITTDPGNNNAKIIVAKYNTSGSQRQYMLWAVGTGSSQFKFQGAVSGAGTSGTIVNSTGTTYALNTWYHVAFVDNNTDLRIYVDGSLASTPLAYTSGIFNGNSTFVIGAQYIGDASQDFIGNIDEVAVLSRDLSSSEVSEIYNSGLTGNNGAYDSPKAITVFNFNALTPAVTGTITESTHTIALTVPYGTPVTALVATFTTTGSSVKVGSDTQTSGTTVNDFTNPVTYTVTGADNSTQDYIVTVTISPNTAKAITAFTFPTSTNTNINETDHTIAVTVPYGTNVTALVPTITITGSSVSPASGVAHDFTTNPQTYTVTAGDSSQQAYAVTVTVAVNPAKAITAFTFPTSTNTNINETDHTIAVTVPYGTNVTALVATFTTTGSSVKIGSDTQTSGATANNFTSPVVYTVTAADSSTQNYTVTVTASYHVFYNTSGVIPSPIYTQTGTDLDALCAANPTWSCVTYGQSAQGRDIRGIVIAPSGYTKTILLDGGEHANETIMTKAVLDFLSYLSANPGLYPNIRWVTAPLLNPDGAVLASGARNNNTTAIDAPTPRRVNLNRNFPQGFGQSTSHTAVSTDPSSEVYIGPYAESEPETLVMENIIQTYHPNQHLNGHRQDNVLYFYSGMPTTNATNISTYLTAQGFEALPFTTLTQGGFYVDYAYTNGVESYMWEEGNSGNVQEINRYIGTVIALADSTPVYNNGILGTNNGASFNSLTSGNAYNCYAGTVTSFTGTGPWTWHCAGVGGGTDSGTGSASINQYSVTPSTGSGGTISPATVQSINYGTTTQFTITPSTGYSIDAVSGTCGGSLVGNTYTTNAITSTCTVSATFIIDTHTLTYTAGSHGSITGTSPQTVNYGGGGSAVTAVAGTGYHFINWSDDSTVNPRTDTNVTNNVSVTANFAINTYTLTYTAGTHGTISGTSPQTVNYGSGGSAVTAVPDSGYHFTSWDDGGLTAERTDTSITANHTYVASFEITAPTTYTITSSVGSHGSISPSGATTVNSGDNQSFSITADSGYHVSDVAVDGSSVGAVSSYSFSNVSADHTISATFAVTSSGGGGCYNCYVNPAISSGGFKISINGGASTTPNRNVFLGFNGGADIKKIAISMTGDFTDASQENYVASKPWDLCSKLGGAIKNPTCPDGKYTVYAKLYTAYGRSSDTSIASSTITLKSSTTSVENLQQYTNLPFTNPFTKYLQYRQTNADIKRLQIFLNADPDTKIADTGAGSPSKETNYFGLLTYKAVIKFQEKYAKDILDPWGFKKGTGYIGKTTLAKINELMKNK